MHDDPALTPEFVDAVARRVLDLSRRKLRVSDVAEIYGVHPTWVYAHAEQLGAVRLGVGPKAPLRFDPETIDGGFRTLARGEEEDLLRDDVRHRSARSERGRRRRGRGAARQIELLPIDYDGTGTRARPSAPTGGRSSRRPS